MFSIPTRSAMDQSCRKLLLKFVGYNTIPNCFIYNGGVLTDCPVTNIDYKLHNGDTINIINKDGFKHGTWLEFYDSGQILNKRIYKHGRYIEGFQYDRNGQVIHRLYERGTMIIEEKK